MFSLVIILFILILILIGRRAKGWVWGRNCIVGNWKMVNDIISHERRSKVLTSQSRHAAKRNLLSFIVDSADYGLVLLAILYTLYYIYYFCLLFIDVLSFLPPEWSITVCKVNVQSPLIPLPPYIPWLFIDVLSLLLPTPEWTITVYKVNVQSPLIPPPHLPLMDHHRLPWLLLRHVPNPLTHPPFEWNITVRIVSLVDNQTHPSPPPPTLLLEWCIPSNLNCTVSLSAVTVSTTGMVTESQDTDGMRPSQAAAVIHISVLYSVLDF